MGTAASLQENILHDRMSTDSSHKFHFIPMKHTWRVDFIKPMRPYIRKVNVYPKDWDAAVNSLQQLRNEVIATESDIHEASLDILYRYYDQLVAIQDKVPFNETKVRISFKWQDAFYEGSSVFAGSRVKAVMSDAYERACILFNIAAKQSQIAARQHVGRNEGLQSAAKLFNQSSGIFNYLKGIPTGAASNSLTPDMKLEPLATFSTLMLAQGQDCICKKAILDRMKPALIARLCKQASHLYADVVSQLEHPTGLWPLMEVHTEWVCSAIGKQALFSGLAEFHQSEAAREEGNYGELVTRLKHACVVILAAETRVGCVYMDQSWNNCIKAACEQAKRDNDTVYNARVADINTFPEIERAVVAKPLPITNPMSVNFVDLFNKVE